MKRKVCVNQEHRRRLLIKLSALAVVSSLTATLIPPVAAVKTTVGSSVKPTCDEAFYATLDYYGNLKDASVVKSYSMNGVSKLTDYGTYDDVINLTDGSKPTISNGVTTFNFRRKVPEHFYFEAKTKIPFETLPWKIKVSYQLNGVPAKAKDLAGKSGVVKINLDIVPNSNASEYAKNNYTLEAIAVFNQNDILSLKADGAQVQLIGNLRQVLFLAMPGEEQHFTIEVGADKFEFDGMTFLLAPATLMQLDDIAKMSDDKDDIETNYKKLDGSLDTVLNSIESMSGSLRSTATGLDELNQARGTISSGKNGVYDNADQVIQDLGTLSSSLSNLPSHIDSADQAVDDVTDDLNTLTGTVTSFKDQLSNVRSDLDIVQKDLKKVKSKLKGDSDSLQDLLDDLGEKVDDLRDDVSSLKKTLTDMNLKIGGSGITINGMTPDQINETLNQVKSLDAVYREVGNGNRLNEKQFLEAALIVQAAKSGKTLSAAEAEQELAALSAGPKDPANPTDAEKKAAAELQLLEAIYTAVVGNGGSMNETQFIAAMMMAEHGTSKNASTYLEKAKQAMQLYELSQSNMTDGLLEDMSDLCDILGSDGLSGNLSDLAGLTADTLDDLDDLNDTSKEILEKTETVLDQVQTLNDTINSYVPDLKSTLKDTKSIVTSTTQTLGDTCGFLQSFESLLKKSGKQLDSGTQKSLTGLAETLRKAAKSLDDTKDVRKAKNTISDIIKDEWNKHTGDKDNLLNMDSTAKAVSLTSTKNTSPKSVQALLRTQEIKVPENKTKEEREAKLANRTFLQRIKDMFQGIGEAIVSAFQH